MIGAAAILIAAAHMSAIAVRPDVSSTVRMLDMLELAQLDAPENGEAGRALEDQKSQHDVALRQAAG